MERERPTNESTRAWSVPAHGRVLEQPGDALTRDELLRLLPHLRSRAELADARRAPAGSERRSRHALTSAERERMARSPEVAMQLAFSGHGDSGPDGTRVSVIIDAPERAPKAPAMVARTAAARADEQQARLAAQHAAKIAAKRALRAGTAAYRMER